MMRRIEIEIGIGIAVAVALALTPQLLWAQSNVATGQVFGTATDPDGGTVPGVSIQARNAATGFTRSAVTDASGFFRIDLLPSGTYEIRSDLEGFRSEIMRGVMVSLGSTVRVDIAMNLSAVEEEIVVTARSPVVETTNPSMSSSVSDEAIANLPLQGRDFSDFVLLTPGSVPGDVDQVLDGRNGINVGARAIQNSFNIDGSNSQSSFFGEERGGTRPPFTFSQSAIKEMQVLKTPYNLQYSASGAVINAITKSGTNDLHGEVFGYLTNDSLTAEDALGRKETSEQLQYGFALGGPLKRDKLHFFTSLDTQDFETPHFTQWGGFPAGREAEWEALTGLDYEAETSNYPVTNDALVILLKLDWQLGENHLFTGRYNYSDQEGVNLTSSFNDVGLSNNGLEANSFNSLVFTLNSVLSDSAFNEAFVQYATEERPRAPNNTSLPETQIRGFRGTFGNTQFHPSNLDEERWQLVDNLTYYAGNHTLKGGINFDLVTFDNYFPRYASGVYQFTTWDDLLDGATPRSFDQSFSDFDWRVKFDTSFYALYLQDDWRTSPNLTITYGLRYDYQDNQQPQETNPLWPETGRIPNDSDNISLRAGFAWDVNGDGKSVLRGGFGRFYDFTPTILTSTARLSNGVRTVRISQRCSSGDACPDYPGLFGSQGDLEASIGDIFFMDPNFENSETDQVSLGYERQVGGDFSVGVDVIYYETNQLQFKQDQNIYQTGELTPDGRPMYDDGINPNFDQIVMYTSQGWAEYLAVVLKAHKRFSNNWFFDASYTWSDAKDNNSNERSTSSSSAYPEDQYVLSNDWGPSDFDVRHKFVASMSWRLPYNFLVSAIGSYRSGYPFTASIDSDVNGDSYFNDRALEEVSPGVYFHHPRNGERQPNFKNLDLRLSWTARLGGSLELELIAEAFNLTGAANWYTTNFDLVDRNGEIDDSFGELNRVGKPRRYQMGAKFRF
jgi:outer membrane receptor protein involved in Fe transport